MSSRAVFVEALSFHVYLFICSESLFMYTCNNIQNHELKEEEMIHKHSWSFSDQDRRGEDVGLNNYRTERLLKQIWKMGLLPQSFCEGESE